MNPKQKFICIHGHFYQPPRENAWLEVVEKQDSAAPFHDWNGRINFECYAPNASARILEEHQVIKKIVNNYEKISFNFGPTLLSWLAQNDQETYQAILNADKESLKRFNGHGSAIAQVYSHLIMPLANRKDKETQIKWGLADFEYRFGRKSEGIWLAETAVDTETLEILADYGVKYTILAPRQAKAFRKIEEKDWSQLGHAEVEPRRPYLYKLPSGKTITLFFYDGNVSQDVAFKGILNDGRAFAGRLMDAFSKDDSTQLVHIATDGESYGHHHRYGEMALASCLQNVEESSFATLTNYGEYLEKFPPEYEIQIHENSSWSCVHGVERWRSNCGCNTGGHGHWTQTWRAPLRETLDWLRDNLIPIYEKEAGKLLKDVWQAREDYIFILLNRTDENISEFLKKNLKKEITEKEKTQLFRLMEMQRHAMLMYTSCAWFFSEVSGIETNQVLQYANRAIYYAQQVSGKDFHPEFLNRLERIPSNIYDNGAVSYRKNVMPARVDLKRVAMHFAASSLFEEYPEDLEFFNYEVHSEVFEKRQAGLQKLAIGRTTLKSKITHSKKHFSFAVLYLGQQNMIGYVSIDMSRKVFDEMHEKMIRAFRSTNLGDVIGYMQTYFGEDKFTIWHLFRDEKRKILKEILEKNLVKTEAAVQELYNDNYQLMMGMKISDIPIPNSWKQTVNFILNRDFERFFKSEKMSIREFQRIIGEYQKWDISIDEDANLEWTAGRRIYWEMIKVAEDDCELNDIQNLVKIIEGLGEINVHPRLWKAQNLFFQKIKKYENKESKFPNENWKEVFYRLGELLKVRSLKNDKF